MSRLVDSSQLLSKTDIADLLGVVPNAVTNWSKRGLGFPKPVATVGRGHTELFLKPEVLSWYVGHHDVDEQVERTKQRLADLERTQQRLRELNDA